MTDKNCNKSDIQTTDNGNDVDNTKMDSETSNFLSDGAETKEPEKLKLKDGVMQILASCIVHCIVIQAGVNMAYSTVLVHGLKESGISLNKDEESWISSLVTISLPIGSILTGPLIDKFGRKAICIFSCIPIIASWIILILANSVEVIYIARLVAGLSAGLTSTNLVYVSEIANPQLRPMVLCLNSVFVSFGILLSCSLGVILNWRHLAMVFCFVNCCVFIALFFVPESPYWLFCFKNGSSNDKRIAKAEKCLRWLNPNNQIYDEEHKRLKETSQRNTANSEDGKGLLEALKFYYSQLILPQVYKPVVILLILFLIQQLSGSYVVIFYAITIFQEVGGSFGSGINEHGALVLLGVIRFAMSIVTVFLSKIYGRRTLCILSGLGMMFSMFFSSLFLFLSSCYDENGVTVEVMAEQKWLLLVIILFYVCASSLGFLVIPWTMIGEMLPISVRGIGTGFMISAAYLMMFAVVKSYPYALGAVGSQGVFTFFSATSFVGTCFIYFYLPETLGKTFSEIEKHFEENTQVDDKVDEPAEY